MKNYDVIELELELNSGMWLLIYNNEFKAASYRFEQIQAIFTLYSMFGENLKLEDR